MKHAADEGVAALPKRLAERSRIITASDAPKRSAFVLYWMHHAVRGHENPALDVAILEGNRIGLPVVVYQGLDGHHRYNNDRHHTFILEGARDAHRALTTLGVCAAFHLDNPGGPGSRLRELAARAALVVVEDYPAPPFKRWTKRLSDAVPCPVIAVDCACIVPMRLQPKQFDRPFDETPVMGRVRTRSTAAHARRLDIDRYRARVSLPASGDALRIAVIGAGVSGLAAARALHDQGHRVRVFEKSRGLGGRAATRRIG